MNDDDIERRLEEAEAQLECMKWLWLATCEQERMLEVEVMRRQIALRDDR
jgi:hypothetical protein